MKALAKRINIVLIVLVFSCLLLTGCNSTKEKIHFSVSCNENIIFENQIDITDCDTVYNLMLNLKNNNSNFTFEGNEGPYGFYIISINGIQEKLENNKYYYWALYIDNEYAQTGVSTTKLRSNMSISFKYESFDM